MRDNYHYRRFDGKLYLLYKAFKHKTSRGANRYRDSAEAEAKDHWSHRKGYSCRIAQLPKEQVHFGRKWGVYVRDIVKAPEGQHWTHDSIYPGPGNEKPQAYLDELWEKKHKREKAKAKKAAAPKHRPARAKTTRKRRRAPEKRVRTFGLTRYYLYKVYRNKRDAQAMSKKMHQRDFHARLVKAGPRRYEVWWDVDPSDRKYFQKTFR